MRRGLRAGRLRCLGGEFSFLPKTSPKNSKSGLSLGEGGFVVRADEDRAVGGNQSLCPLLRGSGTVFAVLRRGPQVREEHVEIERSRDTG